MNKLKSYLNFMLLTATASLLGLSANARPWAHEGSDLPVDPSIEWGHLENGIRYVIMPWSEPPQRASMRLLVEAGSLNESERQKGLAHVIEHMSFNGTRHFSAGEIIQYFQRLGMSFGGDTNAYTTFDHTLYMLDLPHTDSDLLHDSFKLLRDFSDGILFEEEEVEKERGVVLSEHRDSNSPAYEAQVEGLRFSIPDSLIPERWPIGDPDVIRMATRQDLVDFYNKWYNPERIVLVIVGDVDPAQMKDLIKEYFADMQSPENPPEDPDLGTVNPAGTIAHSFSDPEIPMGSLEIYTRRKVEPRQDKIEYHLDDAKIDLSNAILSRRFEKLSKQEDAAFSRGTGYDYRFLDFVRYSGVAMSFEPQNWTDVIKIAVNELNRAREFGFSEAELAEVKANMINGYEEAAARASTRKSRDISTSLARAVNDDKVVMDPVMRRNVLVPIIEAITLDEVNETFRKAWDQEERLVNLEGNFDQFLVDQFAASDALEVTALDQEKQKPWAYTTFGKKGEIAKEQYIEDLGIHQLVLTNGIRLNLKQTDYEANKIHVKASIANGKLQAPMDKPGLSLLAGATFIAGGLGEHSNDEIQALTAGKTVAAGFSVEDGEFTVGGVTNEDDLQLQLQLLAAYISDPGFRPEGERLFRRQLDGLYSQLAHEPNAILQNEVAKFLASGDPRFGFPLQEELEQLSTRDVEQWLNDPLKSAYLELSIVGDFKKTEEVVEMVLETFGALPDRMQERPELEEARMVHFPNDSDGMTFSYESESPRAIAAMYWPTTDQSDIVVTRRLSVLASIFSNRMLEQIREEIGEAYSPYAYNASSDTYRNYGVFHSVVGVQPQKAELIQDMLIKIGKDLAESGTDEDELVRAIEPIKTQIEEYRRTNGYWLNSVMLRSQTEPKRLDWARSFEGFWETVTIEQINELAQKYLKPESAVPVQVQPK